MSRFVFCLRNLWYFRILTSCIEEVLKRGHAVEICVFKTDSIGKNDEGLKNSIDRMHAMIANSDGRLTYKEIDRGHDGWSVLDLVIARTIDFFHFRSGRFEGKDALAARAKGPPPLRKLLEHKFFQSPGFARFAGGFLRWIERHSPSDPHMAKYLTAFKPDLVVFSPLIDLGLSQFQHLRTARRLGLKTALVVNSWDNLSSKAWLRDPPDLITVWNDVQVEEAQRFHGIGPERIKVTGAPGFDNVFAFKSNVSRADFLAKLGLPADKPLITYVASATLNPKKQPESEFVTRWINAVRASEDARLREASILVRPHPKRRDVWLNAQQELPGPVLVWPPVAENPVDESSIGDYLHTLAHSDVIVGLNTSAFLEGAILRRPILTVLDKAYAASQLQTFHFDYLVSKGKGILRTTKTLKAHIEQLSAAIANPVQTAEERAFIVKFLRPRGEDRAATQVLADVLQDFAAAPRIREPRPDPMIAKVALWPAARYAGYLFKRDEQLRRSMKL